jgi:hypothetical protein
MAADGEAANKQAAAELEGQIAELQKGERALRLENAGGWPPAASGAPACPRGLTPRDLASAGREPRRDGGRAEGERAQAQHGAGRGAGHACPRAPGQPRAAGGQAMFLQGRSTLYG